MPAGFDKATVFNMALSHAGSKSTVEDPDESNRAAGTCRTWYETARYATLEVHNWGFARKSLALSDHSVDAPTNRWAYRYQYPSDCVQPRYIENPAGTEADAIPFEVEEAGDDDLCIVTDQEDACLLYTRNHSTLELWTMHATMMLALRLGILISPEIAAKTSRTDRLERQWRDMVLIAPTVDGRGQVPRAERDASWIRGRT